MHHKPRYTLITHPDTGEKVWAEVLTGHTLCNGCSLREYPCVGLSPPCTARYRPDNREVIFVTEVEKW